MMAAPTLWTRIIHLWCKATAAERDWIKTRKCKFYMLIETRHLTGASQKKISGTIKNNQNSSFFYISFVFETRDMKSFRCNDTRQITLIWNYYREKLLQIENVKRKKMSIKTIANWNPHQFALFIFSAKIESNWIMQINDTINQTIWHFSCASLNYWVWSLFANFFRILFVYSFAFLWP